MNMSEELFDSVVNELERKHISSSSRKFLKQYKDALAEVAERNEDDNEENLPAANIKVPVVNKRKKRNPNEPTIEENKWIIKVDLNEFENDPTDLSVGIDFSKGLIIPRGKCDQWITRPDGMKIHQSGWAKEISVPDIVEIKPALKLDGKVLIIECELTQVSYNL
ncbi:Oidioi.mRNA.OKI2018_I69.PAR.g12080.t1.cds [Oikopleura dioica]|uniref:Oidioi.mRNA.OKI2018_I69.PAR.g12080.t1.cds n=1 Tax=Oikopleura dioica TaxID=34765 RepID=A0ABN7RYL4_OIKDI|nr:Oidioi.mRNA.OKI2018_I69.PAR.g12080.t1.cds [Oikopleura dioica]